jgi:hypothetical protein
MIEAVVVALIFLAAIGVILLAWALFTLVILVGVETVIVRLNPSRRRIAAVDDPVVIDLEPPLRRRPLRQRML